MKIIDKFKEMFSKIFNRDEQPKALPEAISTRYEMTTYYRDDGTSIGISPMLDKLGNQAYETVLNYRTGQLQYLPKYNICSEEINNIRGCNLTSIVMDVDSRLLQDPTYSNYIVNSFLGTDRIYKIFNEYEGYAGGISINERGEIGRYIDQGIVQSLNAVRLQKNEIYEKEQEKRNEEWRLAVEEKAKNIPLHIKDSHAEELSR